MNSAGARPQMGGFMTNPAINRIVKACRDEQSSTTASYAGVIAKTLFFLVITLVGVSACFIIHQIQMNSGAPMFTSDMGEKGVFLIQCTAREGLILLVATVATALLAIINVFARRIVAVTGTLYCLAEGYLLAFITGSLAPSYKWMGIVALLMTIVLVASLLFLYSRGAIAVSPKSRKVISATFITIIIGSVLLVLMSFIPGLNAIAAAVSTIMANPVVGIIFGIAFVVIACMFLVTDFDTVKQLVDYGMPKQYEWECAYGIAYTVLYLYIKILQLIIRIFGKKNN